MKSRNIMAVLIAALLLVSIVLPALAAPPANQHFQRTWARTDQPVMSGQVSRTWMWGPEGYAGEVQENYQEAPGGVRTVQYFDKSRMEITNPDADQNSIWYVTNGLLVMELITGEMQLGDAFFLPFNPAAVNVAGDSDDPTGPTYATFGQLLDAPSAVAGSVFTQRVDREGNLTSDPSLAIHNVTAAHHVLEPGIDHQVASVFWTFMNSTGPVYENGSFTVDKLFQNPFYATGYPVTEPYWADVKIGGTYQDVLMQCFERRCLTYNPANPAGWQVEAGNVGQHYHHWRYVQVPSENEEEPGEPGPSKNYQFTDGFGILHDPDLNLNTVTGLALGHNNILYVVDALETRVQMYSLNGVYLGGWGANGNGNSEFLMPGDVAIDSDGNVYVTDGGNDRVQKFSANGVYLGQWGSTGAGDGQFGTPDGIAINDSDEIYVVDYQLDRVQRFNTSGDYLGQFGSTGNGDGQFESPRRIAIDSEGNLYITDSGNHRVQKFTANGDYLDQWGTQGDGTGEFNVPVGIATIQANGLEYVYVADYMNDRFHWFLTNGSSPGKQGVTGAGYFEFSHPYALVVGPNAFLAISEHGNDRIQVMINDATEHFFIHGDQRGTVTYPTAVAIDAAGDLWVGDFGIGSIRQFGLDGAMQIQLPTDLHALDMEFAPNGLLYIAPLDIELIYAINPAGNIVHSWGGAGNGNGQFGAPGGIATDADSNIYVTDLSLNRVQKFALNGAYIDQWGSAGNGNGEFHDMMGIAVHGDRVYIADAGNHRIQVFDIDGNYLFQFGSFGTGEGQFNRPAQIVIDAGGYLFVTDYENGRVQKFTSEGEFVTQIGEQGAGPGQFVEPFGIAVTPAGQVIVSDVDNGRIQVFTPVP